MPILRTMDALVNFTLCNYLLCAESQFAELLFLLPHLKSLHLSDLMLSPLPLGRRHNALTRAENSGSRPRISSTLTELTIQTSVRSQSIWSGLSSLLDQQQIRLSTLYVRIAPGHGMGVAPAQQSFFTSAIASRLENLSLSLPADRRPSKPSNHAACNLPEWITVHR